MRGEEKRRDRNAIKRENEKKQLKPSLLSYCGWEE